MASKNFKSLFRHKKEEATAAHESSTKHGLFFLNEQHFQDVTKAGDARHPVDIVAIHGIDGHPYDSWTHQNGKMWLRDFLPDLLPGARIFTFGYPAEVAFTLGTGKLEDFARSLLEGLNCARRSSKELSRHIIFVCHSMGGIIVKQALVTALIDAEDYANIRDSVIGIFFLSTPHRGSSSTQFPQMLANLANMSLIGSSRFIGKTRTDLIKSLEKDSALLKTLSTNFRNPAANIKIVSFIEQKTSPPLNQRVVDEISGIMDLPKETIIPMDDCDHRTICRFADVTNPGYRKVSHHLEKLAKVSITSRNLPLQSQITLFTVPFEQDPKFIGREDIIAEIDRRFASQSRVALTGIGGVGKSQIAIEYCYRFRIKYPLNHVLWIHASSLSRVDQTYKDIARKLSIPGHKDPNIDTYQLVSEWLKNNVHGGWLFILDNADDMEVFFPGKVKTPPVNTEQKKPLVNYLPHNTNGLMLITTRDKRVGENLANSTRAIKIDPLAVGESEELFWSKFTGETTPNKTKATELLEALEYLPLAITQAAAYISENNITVEEYLEILRTEDSEFQNLLSEDLTDIRRDFESPTSVIRTWKVSFDQIKKQTPRAVEILSLMAVLDRQGVPKMLLQKDEESRIEFITALGTLQAFSFISAEREDASFEMHRLVQASTQRWLELQGEIGKWQEQSLKVLDAAFPSGSYGTWSTCEKLYPHAQVVVSYIFAANDSLIQHAKVLERMSNYELERGLYDLAYEKCLKVLSIRQELLNPEHVDLAISKKNVALLLQRLGKYSAAEKVNKETLELHEKLLGGKNQIILGIKRNLAIVLENQGKHDVAENLMRQVIKVCEEVFGQIHSSTLKLRGDLAYILGKQGKYAEAEQIIRQVHELFKKNFDPKHPQMLLMSTQFSFILARQGKHDEAEELSRQTLEISEKILGAKHPQTLTVKGDLANVVGSQGKYEDAEELQRQLVTSFEEIFGPVHRNVLITKNNLAITLIEQSKNKDAEEILREIIPQEEQVLGSTHPLTILSRKNLLKVASEKDQKLKLLDS